MGIVILSLKGLRAGYTVANTPKYKKKKTGRKKKTNLFLIQVKDFIS